jgi:hypothetical protein
VDGYTDADTSRPTPPLQRLEKEKSKNGRELLYYIPQGCGSWRAAGTAPSNMSNMSIVTTKVVIKRARKVAPPSHSPKPTDRLVV